MNPEWRSRLSASRTSYFRGGIVCTVIMVMVLAADSGGNDATDCPDVPLTPASSLFSGGTQADTDAIALENTARSGQSISPLADVDPTLAASVRAFLALIGADESIITSGYRPLPYQQHFFDLSTELKTLAAQHLPGVRITGNPPRIEIVNEPRFAADPRANGARTRICMLNREIALHGLQRGKRGGLAVNPPEQSEHTHKPALAVDLSKNALRARRLSNPKIAEFACRAGLWRPYVQSDPVHFESVPPAGDPRLVPLIVDLKDEHGAYLLDPPGGAYVPGCVVMVLPIPAPGYTLAAAPGCLRSIPSMVRIQSRPTSVCLAFKEIADSSSGAVTISSATCVVTDTFAHGEKAYAIDVSGTASGPVGSIAGVSLQTANGHSVGMNCFSFQCGWTYNGLCTRTSSDPASITWSARFCIGLLEAGDPFSYRVIGHVQTGTSVVSTSQDVVCSP